MALPGPGNSISANQINVEATRSGTANAPLSGTSSTPQAGSLVKIYEAAGVPQGSPHAFSELHSKSFVSVTGFNCTTNTQSNAGFACLEVATTTYYFTPTSSGQSFPIEGNNVWSNAAGTTKLASGWYRMGNFNRFNVNSNGTIQNGTIASC